MRNCPICQTVVESYTETYISPYNKEEYKKYECPSCDVNWWEPLKLISEFYENEVFEGYLGFHEFMRLRIEDTHKAFFEHFPKHIKGRLLDVGCGDGVFLKEAQKHGFEVWEIDFDRKSVGTAKKSLKIDTIYAMSLEEFYEFAMVFILPTISLWLVDKDIGLYFQGKKT